MTHKDVSIEDLGRLTVLNAQHDSVALATLWKDRTAVLVFVRHFG